MRYKIDEQPTILGKFNTGDTVTITLYDLSDESSETLTSNACNELGSTGVFYWSTSNITTQPTAFIEYCWVMTNGTTSQYGKIVLGGYPDTIADAVWDEEITDHLTANTTGQKLSSASGRTTVTQGGGLTDDDKKDLAKKIIDYKLKSNRTLADELIAKSEFNVNEDVVKTDIVIPEFPKINLRDIKDEIVDELKTIIKVLDNKKDISTIKDSIKELNKSTILEDLKNKIEKILTSNLDKVEMLKEFNKVSDKINSIKIPEVDFTDTIKAIESLRSEFKDTEALDKLEEVKDYLYIMDEEIIKKDVMEKINDLSNMISKTNDVLKIINKENVITSEQLKNSKKAIDEISKQSSDIEKMMEVFNKLEDKRIRDILIDNKNQYDAISEMLLKINQSINKPQDYEENF
jgi:hypothetical protein